MDTCSLEKKTQERNDDNVPPSAAGTILWKPNDYIQGADAIPPTPFLEWIDEWSKAWKNKILEVKVAYGRGLQGVSGGSLDSKMRLKDQVLSGLGHSKTRSWTDLDVQKRREEDVCFQM